MLHRVSSSSLANSSGIGDEGSGVLAPAFIQKLSIPELNIIYWHPKHPCDNPLHFCLVEIYHFTLEPTICGNITSLNYEFFTVFTVCVKWVDIPYAITIATPSLAVLGFVHSQSACYLSRGLNAYRTRLK